MRSKQLKTSSFGRSGAYWLRGAMLWALLTLAWWAITEGEATGLIWGVPLGLLLAIWVQRQAVLSQLQWRFLPGLVIFYLMEAFQGGVDVAIRAFEMRPRTDAYLMDYELQLSAPWARDVWIGLIGLMPGTLAVGVAGNRIRVHVLDREMAVFHALQRLERHLQRLAGERG